MEHHRIDSCPIPNEAMDLKATLEKFTKENEQLQIYARRMEITATFAEEEFNKKKLNNKN